MSSEFYGRGDGPLRRELLHPGLDIGRGVRPAGRPGQITGHILARVAVHLSSVSSCVVVASCVSAVGRQKFAKKLL